MEHLVDTLKAQGYTRGVLTDINNTTGALEFIRACRQKDFKGTVGIEFRNQDRLLYIGIARNNAGFAELNTFLSAHNIAGDRLPDRAPAFDHAYIVYPFGTVKLASLRDNEYLGIRPSQLTKLYKAPAALFYKLVALQPVTFARPEDWRLHLQLRSVAHNLLLSQLRPEMAAGRDELLPSIADLVTAYSVYPQIMVNTFGLLDTCSFDFDFDAVKNKQLYTSSRYDDRLLLEKLAYEGMERRYGPDNTIARQRIAKEIETIDELGFSAYFLITWDMTRYSASQGIAHVGRGSGASSVVAYSLGITNVCPIQLDLYFERFLNPNRKTPPDFDIDYSHRDRDQVFEYMFRRWGRAHTAILGTMSTFGDRSIIREIAKIYGLPKEEIDRLIADPTAAENRHPITAKVAAFFRQLPANFPNLRSVHAGGILISEQPISYYTAVDMPPKGLPTTQFDMYLAEEIGFEKLDILSQRGISNIKEAATIIRENRGVSVDVDAVNSFFEDAEVKRRLISARAIGCFYIESPAMRQVLLKLRCQDYLTLVAASSIIRPGVGSSGMMRTFIHRHHNPGSFTYAHPILKQQLSETYGVMIYQEDVLKVAIHYAGLSPADADSLRRAMSGKDRGGHHIEAIRQQYFSNCAARGYDSAVSAEIWRQIESFAGYSFAKAHSASYAIESYQCLFLKSHYPREYLVAVVNNGGGFYHPKVYLQEARKEGALVHLPCVNNSRAQASIKGADIYLGLGQIDHLNTDTITRILAARSGAGPFGDLESFIRRTRISQEQLHLLIRVGALRFTGSSKKNLLWQSYPLQPAATAPAGRELITATAQPVVLPVLEDHPDESYYDEMELLHFPVSCSAFDMLRTAFRGEVMVADLPAHQGQTVRMVGHYICQKSLRTKKGEPMAFGTFWDAKFDYLDTVHFSESLKKYPLQGAGTYLIEGKVSQEYGVPALEVIRMAKLPIRPDPRLQE